jgi:hypothetical protein
MWLLSGVLAVAAFNRIDGKAEDHVEKVCDMLMIIPLPLKTDRLQLLIV